MMAGREKRGWRGARGAFRRTSKVQAVQGEPEFSTLLPLLEFVPPLPPSPGLLAQIENRIDAIDRARSAAEARVKSGWRILGAGLAGTLVGAAAMAALLLGDPSGIRP